MKNKGFTLIELIATMVVLSILMLIAIPNVVGIITRNRNATYIEDAKKLATLGEYKYKSDTNLTLEQTGDCIIMKMSYLDNGDIQDAPNGGEYKTDLSYVVVKRDTSTIKYYVQLVEEIKAGRTKGVKLTDRLLLSENDIGQEVIEETTFAAPPTSGTLTIPAQPSIPPVAATNCTIVENLS